MGLNYTKWWKCKDEMMVEYKERVRRKYEELDVEMGTVEGEWTQYKDAFVWGWRSSCVVECWGKEVHREAERSDGGRKRWRRQWGRSGIHGI